MNLTATGSDEPIARWRGMTKEESKHFIVGRYEVKGGREHGMDCKVDRALNMMSN